MQDFNDCDYNEELIKRRANKGTAYEWNSRLEE